MLFTARERAPRGGGRGDAAEGGEARRERGRRAERGGEGEGGREGPRDHLPRRGIILKRERRAGTAPPPSPGRRSPPVGRATTVAAGRRGERAPPKGRSPLVPQICGTKAKPQRIVTTRLLYHVQPPVPYLSRLQRI